MVFFVRDLMGPGIFVPAGSPLSPAQLSGLSIRVNHGLKENIGTKNCPYTRERGRWWAGRSYSLGSLHVARLQCLKTAPRWNAIFSLYIVNCLIVITSFSASKVEFEVEKRFSLDTVHRGGQAAWWRITHVLSSFQQSICSSHFRIFSESFEPSLHHILNFPVPVSLERK